VPSIMIQIYSACEYIFLKCDFKLIPYDMVDDVLLFCHSDLLASFFLCIEVFSSDGATTICCLWHAFRNTCTM